MVGIKHESIWLIHDIAIQNHSLCRFSAVCFSSVWTRKSHHQVSAAGEVLVANRFEAYPGRWAIGGNRGG
jgi:hypothetical protein